MGTLRRQMVSAASLGTMLAARQISALAILFVVLLPLAALGFWVLEQPPAKLPFSLAWAALSGWMLFALASLVQVLAPTRKAGVLFSTLVFFPLLLVGGSFLPFENMPAFLAAIGSVDTDVRVAIERTATADPVAGRYQALLAENGFVIDGDAIRTVRIDNSRGDTMRVRYAAGEPSPMTRIEELRLRKAALLLQDERAVLALRGGDDGGLAALSAEPRTLAFSIEPAGRLGRVPTGFEQTIPGILVMFTMLILLTSGGVFCC